MTVLYKSLISMTVSTAMVVSTVMTFTMMVMMIAPDIGIKAEIACQQIQNCGVSVAAAATVEGNAGLCQCHLGTTANTTANQHIHTLLFQKAGQCAMAVPSVSTTWEARILPS